MRFLPLLAALLLAAPAIAEHKITWKKTVLDDKFRSEGVAIADVNKDGKIDVLNGEYWYEAPDWKKHELQPPKDHGTGERGYSRSFACWSDDFNGDGYPDLIVIDFPGAVCYWMENPKGQTIGKDGKPIHWKKHGIWHSACNETPIYADLFGTGKRVLIMASQPIFALIPGQDGRVSIETTGNEGQMAYFAPNPRSPNALWQMHAISEPSTSPEVSNGKEVPGTRKEIPGTQRFSHGLGMGDMNGDGKMDVICTGGWWAQPSKVEGRPWAFHPATLGPEAADMFVLDLDGDGKVDVLSSSAHKYGIWWHQQRSGKDRPTFMRNDLFKELVSETHAMHFQDIDGDGLKDLITGKRFWSHGRGEPGADKAAMIYWLKASKSKDGVTSFTPMEIDNDSGIGTQFEVADINGDKLLDVIVSNKKGVCVIVQERK